MIRISGIFCLLLMQLPLYGDLGQLYSDRLENNLLYKQTLLKLEEAKLGLRHYDRNYIPSLSVNTTASQFSPGPGLTNGETNPYTITTQFVFNNIFGSTIQLSVPYMWDRETGHRIDSPALTVSRPLFAETGSGYLKAKAQVLENEYTLQEIRIETGITLVRDISTIYFSIKSEQLYSKYMNLLQKNLKGIKNKKDRNDMQRKIYSVEKLFLKAQHEKNVSELADYAGYGEIEALYVQLGEIAAEWEWKIEEQHGLSAGVDTQTKAEKSKDIEALELSLEAARREAAFWFLPYLPNPTFYANMSYNFELDQLNWGLGFTFSIPLVDHGERDLESRKRRGGEDLAQLELEDKNSEHERAVKNGRYDIEVLKIEMDILELDRVDAHDAFLEAEQLYEKEIINESDYKLKKLDDELAVLALIEKKSDYYITLLNLLAEQNTEIGGFFNEEDN